MIKDIDIQHEEVLYRGFLTLTKYHLRFKKFDGTWSEVVTREVSLRRSAVVILLYDPVLQKLVLVEQVRFGAMQGAESPWLIEAVAGIMEHAHEEPLAVALREAKEEAHLEVLDVIPAFECWISPGSTNEYFYFFCGRVDASHVSTTGGLAEEHEDLRVHGLDVEVVRTWLCDNKIKSGTALLMLQWFFLNKATVDARWV